MKRIATTLEKWICSPEPARPSNPRARKAEIRTKRIATTPKSDEKNCDYVEKADLQSVS